MERRRRPPQASSRWPADDSHPPPLHSVRRYAPSQAPAPATAAPPDTPNRTPKPPDPLRTRRESPHRSVPPNSTLSVRIQRTTCPRCPAIRALPNIRGPQQLTQQIDHGAILSSRRAKRIPPPQRELRSDSRGCPAFETLATLAPQAERVRTRQSARQRLEPCALSHARFPTNPVLSLPWHETNIRRP